MSANPTQRDRLARVCAAVEVALDASAGRVPIYANARNAVLSILDGGTASAEFEALFPLLDARGRTRRADEEYAAVLLRQLAAWLTAVVREPAPVISPELALIDPELRVWTDEAPVRITSAQPRETSPTRGRLPLAAAAYAATAAAHILVFELAFFVGVFLVVLVLSAP